MGNDCLASTPVQYYQSYFQGMEVSELKDYWTTYKTYKIKKLYDKASSEHPQYPKHTHIDYDSFITLFYEFKEIEEQYKKRIFQMFNFDGHGYIDWNNFYSMISVCYFGSEEILSVLMFMIFDDSLSKQLTKNQLTVLCETFEKYIQTREEENGNFMPLYDFQEIVDELMNKKQFITIDQWMKGCKQYFSFSKFRKFFNIFAQERLEKDLIKHFNEWNNLYVESKERYVGYVINYKWFESWKIYVKEEFGVSISNQNNNPITIKTRKAIKTVGSHKGMKGISDQLNLRELKFQYQYSKKDIVTQYPQQIKNYDFVHGNIGQRPKQIDNKVLEGEYEEVLKQGMIENRDYFLVSEIVWKNLKKIYDAFPEFRRTGEDFIELYPKILKIYKFEKERINYASESLKQASNEYSVEEVSESLSKQEITMYFKTTNMTKWKLIDDPEITLGQLSEELFIFAVYMKPSQTQAFEKNYMKNYTNINEINVGDMIKYENPISKVRKEAVFMGKNVEGKYILHFPGESYIYDICILQSQLINNGKLNANNQGPIQQIKQKPKSDNSLIGISNIKGLGFANALILHLYNNWTFRQQISLINNDQIELDDAIQVLSEVFHCLSAKKKVDTYDITTLIKQTLPAFDNFETAMCREFFNNFFVQITADLVKNQMKNTIQSQYLMDIQRNATCLKCNMKISDEEKSYVLHLTLPQRDKKYYQIIYVPYNRTNKSQNIKKYGFKLPLHSTLKEYRNQFQKVAELDKSVKYIFMEVYHNNIVKNFSTAKNEITLDQLQLRQTDTIYAYQLHTDFKDFISQHYTHKKLDLMNRELKIDQFVDCKNETRGWIFGKVSKKDYSPYAQFMLVKVIHKFSKGEQWEITYDADDDCIAHYPTKSYLNGEQYHIRLTQRYFNEASNQMQICHIPIVVVLTNWMRWRQFYYLVYLQMKRFIDNQEQFDDDEDYNKTGITSSKSIESSNRKKTNKLKLNKFKDYLYGKKFPYKLNFVDYDGRCAICFKFLKTQIFQGEKDTYCSGCQLSMTEPISWQIKVSDIMVAIDWKDIGRVKKNVVFDHPSYANMIMDKKTDTLNLKNCLSQRLQKRKEVKDVICCSLATDCLIEETIKTYPSRLNLFLDRVFVENGFIQIMNKFIEFEDTLALGDNSYEVIGVTAIETESNKYSKYKTYLLKQDNEWYEYDSTKVKIIKKQAVFKSCAIALMYKKVQKSQ